MLMICLIVFSLSVIYMYRTWRYQQKRIPPGPPCLPVIGCLPFLKKLDFLQFFDEEYAKKYGALVSFQMGMNVIIVCNDFNLAKELFSRDDLTDRLESWQSRNIRGDKKQALGILFSNGKLWQEQRRFALKTLRNFGFGRRSLDNTIQEEGSKLINFLLNMRDADGDICISTTFNIPIINVLWQIVASRRFEINSKEANSMMAKLNALFRSHIPLTRILFPFLNYILPISSVHLDTLQMRNSIRETVNDVKFNYNPDEPPTNFIEVYLNELNKGQDSNYSLEQLVIICLDFFQAGAQTSSTTLMWAVLFMVLNPKVQSQCHTEIDHILGMNVPPCLDNIKDLPWCHATLLEIQRLGRIAISLMAHYASTDVPISDNVVIPQGASLFVNLGRFLMDPISFPNPDEFLPEHFLTNDGMVQKPKKFVPFGIGKRICLGESLAKHEMFIFFVMMLQKLTFSLPKSHAIPSATNFSSGITRTPLPFFLNIKPRNV